MAWDGEPDRLIPTEPVLISDCFVTGVTSVAHIGGLVRVTLHCDRPGESMDMERIILCRIIMTEADFAVASAIGVEAAQSGRSFPAEERRASH